MKKYIVLIALMVISLDLFAQSNQDDNWEDYRILTELTNKIWTGSGVLMGQEATFRMDWQRVLDNSFIKLEFQNERESKDNETVVFKATAFYKIINDATVVGHWFDNRGVTFPLTGSIRANELTIIWGDDETEKGKTVYYLEKDNAAIRVEDFVMTNDKYLKFGSATYAPKD